MIPEFDSKISIVREMATESLPVLKLKLGVPYHCHFGQEIWLVGSHLMLGDWNPRSKNAVKCNWTEGDFWVAELDF